MPHFVASDYGLYYLHETNGYFSLRYMGTPTFFSMFTKGENSHDFLIAYLEDEVFSKWGLLLKERICSDGSKFLPL